MFRLPRVFLVGLIISVFFIDAFFGLQSNAINNSLTSLNKIGKAKELMIYNIFCPLFIFDEERNGYKLIQDKDVFLDGEFYLYLSQSRANGSKLDESEINAIKSEINSLSIRPILSKKAKRFIKVSIPNKQSKALSFKLLDLILEEVEDPLLLPGQTSNISPMEFSANTPFLVNPKKRFINSFVEDPEAREILLAGGVIPEEQIDLFKQVIVPLRYKLRKTKGTIFKNTLLNNKGELAIVFGAVQPVFTFP